MAFWLPFCPRTKIIVMMLRTLLFTGLWIFAVSPAWAKTATMATPAAAPIAAPATGAGAAPTRMQRCQSEIASLEGATRKRVLRECLVGRAEGERLIGRDCSRQYRSLPAGQSIDKATYIKQCSAGALNVGHKQLPKSKPAAPPASASSGASPKAPSKPASASESKLAPKPVAKPGAQPAPTVVKDN
jgi:hypothetical protein